MQIPVKSSKVLKEGTRKDSTPYQFIAVVAEDTGIEYTTFDKKAHIGAGAILDIGEPDIKDGKHSFKECKIVSEPVSQASTTEQGPTKPSEMIQAEIRAGARNTALTVASTLAVADKIALEEILQKAREYLNFLFEEQVPQPKDKSTEVLNVEEPWPGMTFDDLINYAKAHKETEGWLFKTFGFNVDQAKAKPYECAAEVKDQMGW